VPDPIGDRLAGIRPPRAHLVNPLTQWTEAIGEHTHAIAVF
jgi:hypothetical protein